MDNSTHHSFCPCTSTLCAQTVLGSRCWVFSSTKAERLLKRLVSNIYKGGYFQSVFMYLESFSLYCYAECFAEVEGKEGNYSVFMSRLFMQLLGNAGSCFCLIKGWLMKRAAEVDREKERETLQSNCHHCFTASSTHVHVGVLFLSSEFPHQFIFFLLFLDRMRNSSTLHHSHTWGLYFFPFSGIKGTRSFEKGIFNQEWMEEVSLSVEPVIWIHSIRFKPRRLKKWIHCKTKAQLRRLPTRFFFLLDISKFTN